MPNLGSLSPELSLPFGSKILLSRPSPSDPARSIFDTVDPSALGDAQAALNASNALAAATAASSAVTSLTQTVNGKQAAIPAGTGLLAQTGMAGVVRPIAVGANLSLIGDTLSGPPPASGTTLSTSNPLQAGVPTPGTSIDVARGDHRHPTDTTRAPIASPAFTGTPTAPTAVLGTNTTQLATMAAVKAAVDTVLVGRVIYEAGDGVTFTTLPNGNVRISFDNTAPAYVAP